MALTQNYLQGHLKTIINRLIRNKFVRNVAILATGTAGAQTINMLFSPIVTRIYNPEVFGLLGVFTAAVNILTPIAAFSYPIAIVLPKKNVEAKGIIKLSICISLIFAVFLVFVFLFGGNKLLELVGAGAITAFVLLIPLNMFFSALLQVSQQWLIRKKQFHITAKVAIIQAIVINSSKVGFGWFFPVAAVLIVLTTIGSVLHAGLLFFGAYKTEETQKTSIKEQQKISLLKLAKQYYDFPFYRTPQVLINTISQTLPVFMLSAFFGPASAGFYTICRRVLSIPSQLIGKSVGDVFYPRITEAAQKKENLTKLVVKTTLGLIAIGFFPFVIVIVFGPWLFGFVFGSKWIMAGEYARWLSLMLFFNFINKPAVATIPVLGLQKGLMIYEIFSTSSKLGALYMGIIMLADEKLAIALFSIFGALAYIFLIIWVIMSCASYNRRINE